MKSTNSVFDVVLLGETMVRLTPPGFERFGQSPTLEIHVGGSESNSAVGLARLGHRAAWLSRVTANPMGQWIVGQVAAQGVDVSHIVWTEADRVGTYYLERGRPPRDSHVIYDRAGSAMSCMQPSDLPVELFSRQRASMLHVTGITVGLSKSAEATALHATTLAKAAGLVVSFDLNYRSRLWSAHAAYSACKPFFEVADYVFLPIRDAIQVCQVDPKLAPEDICVELHRQWPNAQIALTLGSEGAVAIEPSGQIYKQPAYHAVEVERLGGGDAFSAGYLSGVLQGFDLQATLAWACAAAALKYTIPGDLPLFDCDMVKSLVNGKNVAGIHR